mgnify:CR=1 FL=1
MFIAVSHLNEIILLKMKTQGREHERQKKTHYPHHHNDWDKWYVLPDNRGLQNCYFGKLE